MEKKQSLAWPCPRPLMTVFYTHPADQSVANPPQKGQGHYQKLNTFCLARITNRPSESLNYTVYRT
jgi:hypothetical protein